MIPFILSVIGIFLRFVFVYTVYRSLMYLCRHFKLSLFVTKFGKICLVLGLVGVLLF